MLRPYLLFSYVLRNLVLFTLPRAAITSQIGTDELSVKRVISSLGKNLAT